MKFTLYTANCTGNAKNTVYPHQKVITSEADLKKAVICDHVCANFSRGDVNFQLSAVVPMDCDNDYSDEPDELQTGADQLNNGLKTIVENNDSLNSWAKQVFDNLLAMANSQIDAAGLDVPTLTIDNYVSVLDGAIASLDDTNVYNQALSTVTEAVNTQKDYIRTQIEAAVRQQVSAQVRKAVIHQMKANGMTDKMLQSDDIQKQIAALCEKNTNEQMESAEIKATVNEQVELQIQKAIAENMASNEVQDELAAASKKCGTECLHLLTESQNFAMVHCSFRTV